MASTDQTKDANDMTFWEHLDALRPLLVRSVVAVLVLMVAAFALKDYIMAIVTGPMDPNFPINRWLGSVADRTGSETLRINAQPLTLINTRMAGQFNMHMMISFYTALILGLPFVLYQMWLFIKPALTERELRYSHRFFLGAFSCLALGVLFGYMILSPLAINFLGTYTLSESIQNFIDVDSYISTVLNLTLTCSLIFELPVLVYFLSRFGVISGSLMRTYRRHAIVALAIGSAVITPPDIVSMILVIIPLLGLYELSILIADRNAKATQETSLADGQQ